MKKGVKIGLIIGSVLAVGTSSYFIYRKVKKKKDEERDKKRIAEENKQELDQSIAELGTTTTGVVTRPSTSGKCSSKFIQPIRNLEMDVNNPYSEIKGVTIYPAQKSTDPVKGHKFAKGFATIRNTPAVNTKQGTFDYSNKVGTVSSGKAIGKIIGETYDNHSPNHRWFKVQLAKKMEDCSGWTGGLLGLTCEDVSVGWVRADTVTFKSMNRTPIACQMERLCKGATSKTDSSINYFTELGFNLYSPSKKKSECAKVGVTTSSADGSMIERYSPNLLGAEVFPHSNWMLPRALYNEHYSGADGEAFECGDMLTDL